MKYTTRDSGKRKQFKSGMQRDLEDNKPRFDLIFPKGQKYEDTLFYRWAMLMMRGAKKYNARNWEKANGIEELERFKASAFRHFMQWYCGEEDEDHAVGVLFNLNGYEYVKEKLSKKYNKYN